MHPDIEALKPKLKEILYDCAVEIRATKAALYLFNGNTRFDLITEFGFKVPIREWADRNDPIVDRCGRGRNTFFVNGLAEEPRFSEILYESQTDRLLVVPLYMRGQLVGLIDIRDKAAKQPFAQEDVPKAQKIADQIVALFANKNVFGQRFISLSGSEGEVEITRPALDQSGGRIEIPDMPKVAPMQRPPAPEPPRPAAPPVPGAPQPPQVQRPPAVPPASPAAQPTAPPTAPSSRPSGATAPQPPSRAAVHLPRLATIVMESHTRAADILVPRTDDSLGDGEMALVRESLTASLSIPGAIVAMFSAFGHRGGVQELAARGPLTDEASTFLQSRINIWLSKRGEAGGFTRLTQQPSSGPAIDVTQLQKVFTAPVNAGALRGMYLTVGFSGAPDRNAHELLAAQLNQLQASIESSLDRAALSELRTRVAQKIIEPDFAHYPDLRRHTDAVVALVDAFAKELDLSPREALQVRLLAIVHDAGMRMLEYDRLYRKHGLTPDELSMLREHVFVGAALVEPLLGIELARAVLCHHERFDGQGYPHGLAGEEIPYIARILQICDAYSAMTDPQTYQLPEPPAEALAVIARGAGAQFDAELAQRFVAMVQRGGPGR